MIKLKKHIACLLFGIFFFPIVFQSIHIAWHHSHGYHCHLIQEISTSDKHKHDTSISNEEKICPICAYQFSINDLSKTSFYRTIIPATKAVYCKLTVQKQHTQKLSQKTPRAPPVRLL